MHFLFLEKGVFLNYNQFDVSGNIDLTIHFTLSHCFVTEFFDSTFVILSKYIAPYVLR